MLNIRIGIIAFSLLNSFWSFCQEEFIGNAYYSYSSKSIPKHFITIEKDRTTLEIPSSNSFLPKRTITFLSRIKKDTLYIIEEYIQKEIRGIKIRYDELVSEFTNTRFYKKSKNIIVHIETEKPYFNKAVIDSIIGDDSVFSVNGKVLIPKKDSIALLVVSDKKKFKSRRVKILKGEKAIKSYGMLGLNGVIEIKGKYKKCKSRE